MKKISFKILSLFIMSLLFLNACSDAGGSGKKEAEDTGNFTYVEVSELKDEPFIKYISLVGAAKAYQEADIAADEGGKIKKFLKDKGDFIKEGDVILVLDNDVLKASLDAAKAQYELAETNFKKQEEIFQQKVTSELQFLNSKYERDAAKANYEIIKNRYDKTFIKAPFSGILDRKFIEEGEFATPGAPIISLVSIDRIKIEAGVPENYVNEVKKGNSVKIIFPDLANESYDEKISYVGSTINTDNRTFPVEVIVNNRHRKIKPELNAEVKIERAKYDSVIVVPEEVVTKTDQGDVVFVVENELAKMRIVNVVSRFNNQAAISEGLKEGEQLITIGYQNLVDGEKVKVLQ